MSKLQLADKLSFPAAEFACEVSAAIGNRGGGKSNGTSVVVEQLLSAEIPVVVLDYVGIHFSLRLHADGKTPSQFTIPVLGGRHGDIELAPTAGAVVAEALVERNSSAVLDMSMMSKGDRCRFATDFAETFFRAKKKSPGPHHLVLEEAQRYCPQRVQPDQARMLGAFEEIAEVGRNFGIGMTLISQRPQKLSKDVLNLADTLFAYRTIGTHERKALAEWVQEKGADGQRDIANELPGLPTGTAIVWCPVRGIYGRFKIARKATYDAGATPTQSRAAVQTKPLDLGELQNAIGKAADDAKANDPRALKVEIARLKTELDRAQRVSVQPVKIATVPREMLAKIERAAALIERAPKEMAAAVERIGAICATTAHQLRDCAADSKALTPPAASRAPMPRKLSDKPAPARQASGAGSSEVGNSGLRRMLVALAQRPQGLTNKQIGVRAGMSSSSGTFGTYLGRARSAGWVSDDGDVRRITDAGLRALGGYEPLPEGRDLAEYWINEMGGGASRMLRVLVDAYPDSLTTEELGERANISHTSGTFGTYLGRLRSLQLVEGRGEIRASEELA